MMMMLEELSQGRLPRECRRSWRRRCWTSWGWAACCPRCRAEVVKAEEGRRVVVVVVVGHHLALLRYSEAWEVCRWEAWRYARRRLPR